LGDPDGLGPELVVRLLSSGNPGRPVILIGPEEPLVHHAVSKGDWRRLDRSELEGHASGVALFVPDGLESFEALPGRPRAEGGRAAGLSLEAACEIMDAGLGSALVTCPLNKAMLQKAGFDFPGHTEFLAERLGAGRDEVCMHLLGDRLRVSLATTHPPLAEVPKLISRERILRCLELTHDLMRRLGKEGPIGVCGLNPHAGESGRIGREEERTIAPAVEEARSRGISVEGPLPGDTVFHFAAQGRYSSVLAMYHDQGLAPLKLLHFGEAVNVTLGLPVVRTSPDHGTGHDLVGTGEASIGSLRKAVELALKLAG
jgi:4-hydroxythreonine-4-phosphate dehydrogenase